MASQEWSCADKSMRYPCDGSEMRHVCRRQFCKSDDLEAFRSPSPEKIQASVKALVAIPRERGNESLSLRRPFR
jgi:hypothetical protein